VDNFSKKAFKKCFFCAIILVRKDRNSFDKKVEYFLGNFSQKVIGQEVPAGKGYSF